MGYITPANVYTIRDGIREELTNSEQDIFNQAKILLNRFIDENKLIITYRGEQKSRLRSRLIEDENYSIFEKLFHIGEKGCHYFLDNGKDVNQKNIRTYIQDVNDTSYNTFLYLFQKISEFINMQNNKASGFNQDFIKYFSNQNNEIDFMKKVSTLGFKNKLKVRDYYYAYLHTLGRNGVSNFSHFVSTSKNWDSAWKFAGTRDNNKLLFHYILPKPYTNYAVYSKNQGHLKNICNTNSFPTYQPLYDEQDEISVKGGLLPHFIFGMHHIENNERYFVVNPYLFEMGIELKGFPLKGLPINQTFFKDIIKTTKYNRYGVVFDDGTFEQENVY